MRRKTPRARAFLIWYRPSLAWERGLGTHAVGIIDVIGDEQAGVRVKAHAALVALLFPRQHH